MSSFSISQLADTGGRVTDLTPGHLSGKYEIYQIQVPEGGYCLLKAHFLHATVVALTALRNPGTFERAESCERRHRSMTLPDIEMGRVP